MLTDTTAKVVIRERYRNQSPAMKSTFFLPFESPSNQWHLLTLTYDGRYSRLYMDGAQVHSKDWTNTYGLIHPPDP